MVGKAYEEAGMIKHGSKMIQAVSNANVPQITPEIRKQVLEPLAESKTGLFDTHPADRDRVASAVLEKAPGIFRLPAAPNSATHPAAEQREASAAIAARIETGHEHFDEAGDSLPATVLFRDFAQLSRTATVMFYEEQLERKIKPEELCSVASLVGAQEADFKAAKVLEEYLHGTASPLRPLPLPAEVASPLPTAEEAAQAVTTARERMLSLLEAYRADFKAYDDADTERIEQLLELLLPRGHLGVHRGSPTRNGSYRTRSRRCIRARSRVPRSSCTSTSTSPSRWSAASTSPRS